MSDMNSFSPHRAQGNRVNLYRPLTRTRFVDDGLPRTHVRDQFLSSQSDYLSGLDTQPKLTSKETGPRPKYLETNPVRRAASQNSRCSIPLTDTKRLKTANSTAIESSEPC